MSLPAHSHVGASSMHRWGECPGSVALSAKVESPPTSRYAAEGTVAHEVAARCLMDGLEPECFLGETRTQDGYEFEVDEDMIAAIRAYVYAVDADCETDPCTMRLVEHKFHLKDQHEGLFGTSDCVQHSPAQKLLRVYDYKHGAGVPVEVQDNPQLLYYALGALLTAGFVADEVETIIVQPRCPHSAGPVRRARISAIDLLDFAATLLEAVRATEAPNAPLKAGEWCRWCPAAAICPELNRRARALAKQEFAMDKPYDAEALAEALRFVPIIEAWAENVRKFAYGEAEHGRTPPGFKLVEKRPRREWRDEQQAIEFLRVYGLEDARIFTVPALRSPAQIEKEVGKAGKAALEPLIDKCSTGTTLVPSDDKREAVKQDAKSDFAEVSL